MIVSGDEISGSAAELIQRTGSIDSNWEFKQWLHVWTISTQNTYRNYIGGASKHAAFPWVRLWDKPDLAEIMATYHITDFVNFPASWENLWYHLDDCIGERREDRSAVWGPYWMLLPKPGHSLLAGEIVGMKRRVVNELFKIGIPESAQDFSTIQRTEFRRALDPFRVMTPQQEIDDETIRASEERSHAVRVRNRLTLSRPPRCR